MHTDRSFIIAVSIIAALCAGVFTASLFVREPHVKATPDHIVAVLDMRACRDTSKALEIGYNYHLLKKFAAAAGSDVEIELCPSGEDRLDSLRSGAIDILAIPFCSGEVPEGTVSSTEIGRISRWLVRAGQEDFLGEIDEWLDRYGSSDESVDDSRKYLGNLSPYKGGRRDFICPYDSLIRVHADSIGWDWHLLAALIYKESRFHLEARSPRGATGLMQIMPDTAERLGFDELVDPEKSIHAGAKLLGRLSDRYRGMAANRTEMEKFALAAYNAGAGRIQDCITFSRQQGTEPAYWEDITAVLPLMRDSSILQNESIRLGFFKGDETVSYVNTVFGLCERFKKICP